MIKLVAANAPKKLPPLQIRARKLRAMDTAVRAFMQPLVLIVQLNCPTATESRAIRRELASCGCSMAIVKGSILRLVLRHDTQLAHLAQCVVGMTAVIRTRKTPADIASPLGDLLKRHSSSNLMHLAGGALLGRVPLAPEGVWSVLQSMTLARESVASASSTLQLPATHVLSQLSSPASSLVSLLERRVAQLMASSAAA